MPGATVTNRAGLPRAESAPASLTARSAATTPTTAMERRASTSRLT